MSECDEMKDLLCEILCESAALWFSVGDTNLDGMIN